MNWEKLGLVERFGSFFEQANLAAPSKVQAAIIPDMKAKNSLLVVAQTGTGKTLSYVLPIIEALKINEESKDVVIAKATPQALIIAPTKELAQQIHMVIKDISHHVKLRSRLLTGGMSQEKIASTLKQSFDILVGTPNKIKTVISKSALKLDALEFVILDEADTLFEMGFQKDLDSLVSFANKEDGVVVGMFSATLPAAVELYINEKFTQKKLQKVSFSDSHKVQAKIATYNIFVSPKERLAMVDAFIQRTAQGRGIIFANQKNQVDEITAHLKKVNPKLKIHALHGDMDSATRLKVSKTFSQGKAQVLVATDVAARGIDVPDLAWVLNYNLPKNAEFYLHRCGRTGRMGKAGSVYNLVGQKDAPLVALINKAVRSQTALNLDTIAQDIEEIKRRENKRPIKKTRSKRVKITKRTRL